MAPSVSMLPWPFLKPRKGTLLHPDTVALRRGIPAPQRAEVIQTPPRSSPTPSSHLHARGFR